MKSFWLKDFECTGCGACKNICPVDAISLKVTDTGFSYPQIKSNCIDCDKCEKTCNRRLALNIENSTEPDVFAAWAKDDLLRYNSTSGGAFSVLAKEILSQKGVVVGASYNKNNEIEHIIIDNINDLEKIRQSKYAQSDILDVYKSIQKYLKQNIHVAFCGAPCQVAGLYAFLDDVYSDYLITIDFICRGVNSPKAYKHWLRELETKESSKVDNVWFKYKQNGWKASPLCTRVHFENNKEIIFNKDENLFMKGYLGPNLYIRPSCGQCMFKGLPRLSCLTLADFWGIDKSIDDDKGVSMLLINNEKGNWLFNKCSENLVVHEKSFNEMIKENACFSGSVYINPKSKDFLKDLDKNEFSKVYKKYVLKSELKTKFKNSIKHPFHFARRVLSKVKRLIIKKIS